MEGKIKWSLFDLRGKVFRTVLTLCLAAFLAPAVCVSAAASGGDGEIRGREEGKKVVRVGYYEDSEGFQAGASDDVRKTGYAYDYYQEIAKYTGWTYEYVYGSWDELYNKLLQGEVDIMAGISRQDSRMSEMLFPNYAMGEEIYYIFVPENPDGSAYDIGMLNGARIGVKSHSSMRQLLETFAAENKLNWIVHKANHPHHHQQEPAAR